MGGKPSPHEAHLVTVSYASMSVLAQHTRRATCVAFRREVGTVEVDRLFLRARVGVGLKGSR